MTVRKVLELQRMTNEGLKFSSVESLKLESFLICLIALQEMKLVAQGFF